MSLRLCFTLTLGVLACAVPKIALAESKTPHLSASAPHRNTHQSVASANTVSSFSLEPVTMSEPLIRQASLTVKVPASPTRDGFSEAPLPDDDLDAPRERSSGEDTKLKADFFQRNHHQVGDALSGGAAANDQRKGRASMAAGVAVAIPLD